MVAERGRDGRVRLTNLPRFSPDKNFECHEVSGAPGKRKITRSQQEVIVLVVVLVAVVRRKLKIDTDTLENSHLSEESE